MKRMTCAMILMFFAWSLPALAEAGQVEFSAKLERIERTTSGDRLVLRVTDDKALEVRIAGSTQVRDENEIDVAIETLRAGDTLKIEAVVTDQGFLALEVKIEDEASELELKGEIQTVDAASRAITLAGLTLSVPPTAEIRDDLGRPVPFSQLRAGDFVKVEGSAGTAPVASQVRLLPPRTARVRLQGTALEASSRSLLLQIPGPLAVPIQLGPETQVNGSLAVGARLEVRGRLTPGLAVFAETVEVEKVLRFIPDEVRMDLNQTRRVDFLLNGPLVEDAVLQLESRDPNVAVAVSPTLALPAGALTGSIEVMSMGREGRTVIEASLNRGGSSVFSLLEVEVESDLPDGPGDELLEVRWIPDKISAPGLYEVQLTLNGPAPQDLMIPLFLKEGSPALVSFPASVLIPAGDRSANVSVTVADQVGRAKVRAALPVSLGGDTDDLEIEIEPPEQAELELEWLPDDLELRPGQQASVTLRLNRPASSDVEVVVALRDGNPAVASGVPERILFRQGESAVSLTVHSTGAPGEVRYRASLPVHSGGGQDDLRIRVR